MPVRFFRNDIMFEAIGALSAPQLTMLCLSAVLVGINKTAIPGIGILPVVLLSLTFEPRLSTGVLLVMLALTDIIAVAYYHRHAEWKIVLRLIPWAFAGLAVGSFTLRCIPAGNDYAMRLTIGVIVLVLMGLNIVRKHLAPDKIPSGVVPSAFYGTLMGATSQLANAAGPISAIYLLAMKLTKEQYIGSGAWLFLIINWTKLPIFAFEGRVTAKVVLLDIWMIPLLLFGGFLGVKLLRRMPQKLFENIVAVIVCLTAIRLLLPPSWF